MYLVSFNGTVCVFLRSLKHMPLCVRECIKLNYVCGESLNKVVIYPEF